MRQGGGEADVDKSRPLVVAPCVHTTQNHTSIQLNATERDLVFCCQSRLVSHARCGWCTGVVARTKCTLSNIKSCSRCWAFPARKMALISSSRASISSICSTRCEKLEKRSISLQRIDSRAWLLETPTFLDYYNRYTQLHTAAAGRHTQLHTAAAGRHM